MGNGINGISIDEVTKSCNKLFAVLDFGCDRGSLRVGAAIMRENLHGWKNLLGNNLYPLRWNGLLSNNPPSRSPWQIMCIVKQSFPRHAHQSNEEYSDLVKQSYRAYCMWAKE